MIFTGSLVLQPIPAIFLLIPEAKGMPLEQLSKSLIKEYKQ